MSRVMSMTGFASVSGALGAEGAGGRSGTLTIKAVNHRHLDLAVRVPAGLEALEAGLRRCVKAAVRRGHVELTLVLEKAAGAARVEVDEALLEAYVLGFRQAAERYGMTQEPDLNALLRMPGVMSAATMAIDAAAVEGAVLGRMQELLERFNEARHAEGRALAADLQSNVRDLLRLTEEARKLRQGAPGTEFLRLQGRLRDLVSDVELSEERLLAEAALLAARGDVEEELVRLRTHLERFLELLDEGGEVGRPLDFLLQEIHREANTLLSKTGGTAGGLRLTEIGLEMKVGLERAREQVQNVE